MRECHSVFEDPIFACEPFSSREAWIWLRMDGPIRWRGRPSVRFLARRFSWADRRVVTFMRKMANAGFLDWRTGELIANDATAIAPHAVHGSGRSWSSLRQIVFERDGFACVYCGTVDQLHCDHVFPRSRGGLDHLDNLVTACRDCNLSKGARTPEEWRQ